MIAYTIRYSDLVSVISALEHWVISGTVFVKSFEYYLSKLMTFNLYSDNIL